MHRLFIDQNVRIEVAEALRGAGHVATHASEVGLSERDDAAIFRCANEKDLAIVTFDADFAERAIWNRVPHPGIIRLRLEPQTPGHVVPILRDFLAACSPESLRNALVVRTEGRVRIRR